MAAVTATLIVLGCLALVGASGAVWYSATADDREAADNKQLAEQLRIENNQLAQLVAMYENLQKQIINAIDYLGKSKAKFAEGGHVYEGEPLAKAEFDDCEKKMKEASIRVSGVISTINNKIKENTDFIRQYGGNSSS